jgi:hypothetical protein
MVQPKSNRLLVESQIGAPLGVAGLGVDGRIPTGQSPADMLPASQKGAPNGLAALGVDGKLLETQFPARLLQAGLDAIYALKANTMPNAKDLGAKGDDTSRPLSTLFATLAAAQAVYPAATALTDELDWAVIQSCINANGGVYLPAGTYRINKTITATNPIIVGDRRMPKLYMTANNLPILDLTTNANVSYVRLTYSRQQTSTETGSDAVRMFNFNGGLFDKIRIDYPARGIFNYGGGYTFSTTFRDCAVGYYSITAYDIRNGGGITGNVVMNLYTHNNPLGNGTTNTSSEPPVQIAGWDEGVLIQLNVEHTKASAAISISNSPNLVIMSMHVEGFTLLGNYNGVFNIVGNITNVRVIGLSIIFSSFLVENIPAANACGIFKIQDGVKVLAENLQERSNTVTVTGASLVFNSSGTTSGSVKVNLSRLVGFAANVSGDATKVPTLAEYNNDRKYDLQNTKYTIYQDTAPTSWTWAVGDRVLVRNPVEAGTAGSKYVTVGYVCITAGTPGTWAPQRVLTGN